MKTGLTLFLLLIIRASLYSQNLVPNPGFEENTGIPNCADQFDLVKDWFNPTTNTPDYITEQSPGCNSGGCASTYYVNAYCNWLGAKKPHSGRAYAAIHTFTENRTGKEYIEVPLTRALNVGERYAVSFYLAGCPNTAVRTNAQGFLFTMEKKDAYDEMIENPQVYQPWVIFIDTGWYYFVDTFTADKPYKYLTLGNFFEYTDSRYITLTFAPGRTDLGSYYIDDVSVEPVPLEKPYLGPDTFICANASITLTSNVEAKSYRWSTGETTRSIVVREPGQYTLAISSYGQITTDEISIAVQPIPTVALGNDVRICPPDSLSVLLNAGTSYVYKWSTGDTTGSITAKDFGSYIVTAENEYRCKVSDSITVINNCPTCIGDLSVFPNPSAGNINLSFLSDAVYENARITIYDMNGQLVRRYTTHIKRGRNSKYLGFTDLASGEYFVSILLPCGKTTTGLVITTQ